MHGKNRRLLSQVSWKSEFEQRKVKSETLSICGHREDKEMQSTYLIANPPIRFFHSSSITNIDLHPLDPTFLFLQPLIRFPHIPHDHLCTSQFQELCNQPSQPPSSSRDNSNLLAPNDAFSSTTAKAFVDGREAVEESIPCCNDEGGGSGSGSRGVGDSVEGEDVRKKERVEVGERWEEEGEGVE